MVTTRDFVKKRGLQIVTKEFRDDQLALRAMMAGELDLKFQICLPSQL